MAPVGVWVPWAEVLMLASRFGMDAHTCEAAAQVWAGFGLAELDPLPRDCKYPTGYARSLQTCSSCWSSTSAPTA